MRSPSSRGRGLKLHWYFRKVKRLCVALFTRAWIEIYMISDMGAWYDVALFTRAWIEITAGDIPEEVNESRPLHEGVD